MKRKIRLIGLLIVIVLLLPLIACGEGERKVFMSYETDPFPENAELLTIRVAGLGGGDCMLITLGDRSMFVDLGTETSLEKIREVISAAGIDHVDCFFNSHPHTDHVGGFMPLVESGFPVGSMITFFDHELIGWSVKQCQAIKTAEAYHVPVIDMKTEDTVPFGEAEITAYRIPDHRIMRIYGPNDLSAILHIRYGDCAILLGADLEGRGQRVLAEEYGNRLKADILKYPHHGANPVLAPFFEAVSPEFAVITNNPYFTKRAVRFMKYMNLTRMAFSSWGIITLQTDGYRWIVSQDLYPASVNQVRQYLRGSQWMEVPFVLPQQ